MFGTTCNVTRGVLLALCALGAACASNSGSAASDQRTFASPEDAVAQLTDACRNNDSEAIVAIFGEKHRDYFASSDTAGDRQSRAAFAKAVDEQLTLEKLEDGKVEIVVGKQEWPAPIPLVEEKGRWRFDTDAGIEELRRRRIGRNELAAIELLKEILDGQYIYKNRDWDGDGQLEFAQRGLASEGKYDGLYWEADLEHGVPYSPLHEFAEREREYIEGREEGKREPWHGYYVKILKAQGSHAVGGALSYLEGENLTKGFAVVAAPSTYGVTGIMSFMVNQNGVIYEKDLGEETLEIAKAMTAFDPDDTWHPID